MEEDQKWQKNLKIKTLWSHINQVVSKMLALMITLMATQTIIKPV